MTFDEKLQVAELLDEMGVDIIEAGFPIASKGDFEAVSEIAKRVKNAVVCGLARAQLKDIDRSAEAIKPRAARPHPHLHRHLAAASEISDGHRRGGGAGGGHLPSRARARHTDDVEWSAMDATRTEHDFLCRCVEAAIKAGATTINIPDTVGYTMPDEFAA